MADAKRQQRPPRTNGSTRRRRSDARDPDIGHTPGQHSAHKPENKIDIPTPGFDTPNCTTSTPEGRASNTTQQHSADTRGPCTGHKSGTHGGHHHAKWTIGQVRSDSIRNFSATCHPRTSSRAGEDNATQDHMQAPAQQYHCPHEPCSHTPCSHRGRLCIACIYISGVCVLLLFAL